MAQNTDMPGAGLSAPILFAAHEAIGQRCNEQNKLFIRCKMKDAHPAACLDQGKQVMGCVVDTLSTINRHCRPELETFAACLRGNNYAFQKCREEQEAFRQSWAAVPRD